MLSGEMSRRLAVSPTESVCGLTLFFVFFTRILPYLLNLEAGSNGVFSVAVATRGGSRRGTIPFLVMKLRSLRAELCGRAAEIPEAPEWG